MDNKITVKSFLYNELVRGQRTTIIVKDDRFKVGNTVYIYPEGAAGDDRRYTYASIGWINNTAMGRILGLRSIVSCEG